MAGDLEPKTQTISETENYIAWRSEEADGETTYHIEIGTVTLHFFAEDWAEFMELARALVKQG